MKRFPSLVFARAVARGKRIFAASAVLLLGSATIARAGDYPAYVTLAYQLGSAVELKSVSSTGTSGTSNKHAYQSTINFTGGYYPVQNAADITGNMYIWWSAANGAQPFHGTPTGTGTAGSPFSGGPTITYNSVNYTYNGATTIDSYLPTLAVGHIRPRSSSFTFYVANPGETGDSGYSVGTVPLTQGGTPVACVFKQFNLSGPLSVHPQIAAATNLSGGSLPVVFAAFRDYHTLVYALDYWHWVDGVRGLASTGAGTNSGGGGGGGHWIYDGTAFLFSYSSQTAWTSLGYNVRKVLTDATAIDSRRIYGTPDQFSGKPPADDPNAPLRGATFNPWIYKGGCFVGNMPMGLSDLSGIARTQFYGTAANATTQFASFSLFYAGYPSVATSDLTASLYAPSSTDPNLSVPSTQANWGNGWSLTGLTALSTTTFNSSVNVNDYVNFTVGTSSPGNVASFGGKVFIACSGSTPEGTGYPIWRYFASPTYGASLPSAQQVFPYTDCAPRLWFVDLSTSSNWTTS